MFGKRRPGNRTLSHSIARRRRSAGRIEPLEPRLALDSTVVFNEIMYNPAGADESLEWVELHNQMGVNMDLSGWRLDGGVGFPFPAGTTLPRGGYLVIASNPAALQTATGFSGALGPYLGQLSNDGERIELVNNSDRVMDFVEYGEEEPWPVGADGGGVTLAKRDANASSEPAENWSISAQRNGTPGAVNFPIFDPTPVTSTLIVGDSAWNYHDSGTDLGTAWRDPSFDDALWDSGASPLYAGEVEPPTGTPTSLVAYWDFNDNVTNHAPSMPANNGAILGNVTYTSDVPTAVGNGKSLSIVGPTSYVNIPAHASLNSPTFTLSYWLKDPGQLTGTGQTASAGHNRITSRGADSFETSVSNGPTATLPANSTLKFHAGGWADTSGMTNPAQWTHVAYVSTGSALSVYANGNLVHTSSRSITPSGAMNIGARVNIASPNEGYTGLLDDMAMWNVALSQASIQQIVSGQATPTTLVVPQPVTLTSSVAGWRQSTESIDGGPAGVWNPAGNPSPPAAATFTVTPTATSSSVIPFVNSAATALGAQGIVAGNNVRYYRSTFILTPLASASATIQMAVDNGAAVYINGQLIATETGILTENFAAPFPSIAIANDGTITVSKFDSHAGSFTGWLSGTNEVIVAVRNANNDPVNAGGFAFKMTVTPSFVSGTTQLALGPTTHYLRNEFDFSGDPTRTTLFLTPLVDDGAVYYLNGFEVYRQNMPSGTVSFGTLASTEIGIPAAGVAVPLSTEHLIEGPNVLAVEVHQGSVGSPDMLFKAVLQANVTPIPPDAPLALGFNEVAGAAGGPFWVELVNRGGTSVNLGGYVLASSDDTATPYVLPAQTLAPGQFLTLSAAEIGFAGLSGDRMFLYRPGQTALVDAVVVKNRLRGRSAEHPGQWLYPDVATPGAANHFALHDDVVINEIMYHPRPLAGTADIPATYDETTLIALDATTLWRYNATNTDLDPPPDPVNDWYNTTYTTGDGWLEGAGLIGYETALPAQLPAPIRTQLANPSSPPAPAFIRTYYFQTTFLVGDTSDFEQLKLRHVIDDGAAFYLNGQEVLRFNLPGVIGDPLDFTAVATGVDNGVFIEDLSIPISALIPNAQNVLSVEVHQGGTNSSDVLFGLELIARRELTPFIPGQPFRDSEQQWVELYNRGNAAVDLTEWELGGGIDYEFAPGTTIGAAEYLVVARDVAAMQVDYPSIGVTGPFLGQISRQGDRIVLRDAADNPADEVRFDDRGKWHPYADGGGSSLELIDADADNAQPQAWAASDETDQEAWQTVTYRGVAQASSVGPDGTWQEFLLGLLDGGEVLLDDVRVTQTPATTPIQLMQNGTFESDPFGTQPQKWRVLGNHGIHGRTVVVPDPDNPANHVLHLVATGPSEHVHNHIETTLRNGAALATIANGTEYEISYRVRWLAGDNQVNTRLYFNRLPKTTIIDAPRLGGTPGAVNSRHQANIGPTYTGFQHSPAVPPASTPVSVSAVAADPNSVASMTLWYSVNNGAWQSGAMTLGANGKHVGTIPGQVAGAVVQFYVEGTDGLGAVSTYPVAGRNSRALYQVADGRARLGGPNDVHNVRLVMTPADANLLHLPTNAMSNDRIGATVVYDERTVYYDVGVRLKGSERGRRQPVRISFDVEFQPDQLFRGIHENIAIDRSGAGDEFSQKEIIVKHVMNQSGDIPSSYDDLIHTITPQNTHTGSAMLLMARHGDEFLDTQFDQGGDGTVYEYELIYYPAGTTDGNPESLKLPYPSPDGVVGIPITNLGDDKERYRYPFLIKNNRDRDDYSRIIAMAKVFALSGAAYNSQIDSVIDVDQWLRSLAVSALTGIGDSYLTGGLGHNARLFADPEDGRVLLFPHDLDFAFSSPASGGVVLNADLPKMLGIPVNMHRYYGHIHDIVTRTFNSAYMTPWINHYDSLLPAESFASFISYIGTRATAALNAVNAAVPPVAFNITTNGGADLSVNDVVATLTGTGWVNVREIRLAGDPQPLPVTWTTSSAWQLTVPVDFGANAITLEAVDFQGNVIATDTITVTSTVSGRPLQDFLRVGEVMYHPADPSPEEVSQGYGDSDEFEYVELVNTSAAITLDLTGVQFTNGIGFDFSSIPAGQRMFAPGERLVIVENLDAFRARYGAGPRVAGQYTGRLDNGGETLALQDASAATIQAFTYDDIGVAWHPSTDGLGQSLVILDSAGPTTHWNDGPRWRPSHELNGSPGAIDVLVGDINQDNHVGALDLAVLQANLGTIAGGNPGDLSGDGQVDRTDVARFILGLGRSYTPPIVPSPPAPSPSPPAAVVVSKPALNSSVERRIRTVVAGSRTSPARATATDQALESLTNDAVPPLANRSKLLAARGHRQRKDVGTARHT